MKVKEKTKGITEWFNQPLNACFLGFIIGICILPILEGFPIMKTILFLEVAQFLMLIYFLFFRERGKKKG